MLQQSLIIEKPSQLDGGAAVKTTKILLPEDFPEAATDLAETFSKLCRFCCCCCCCCFLRFKINVFCFELSAAVSQARFWKLESFGMWEAWVRTQQVKTEKLGGKGQTCMRWFTLLAYQHTHTMRTQW